ncbi:HAD-IA family hydrolase [Pseudaestuariivita atlantica]|uniref:phosphoglycolate phosphatase n=1 Tax=Pseudaestuariivita atlantica TaxID=1317121 RepID=A0A0L1JQH6_9RHOB|nr:HAD-IA family hydrolase [Pseudaestuariivita atlantica]KNG93962.1 haloacid dehalogenase [Pseudaestuariivita atlantica]
MGTVVFDLDGTLADTSGDLLEAANSCFRSLGYGDLLTSEDAGVALRGGRMMLRTGLARVGRAEDEAEVDRQYPALLAAYGNAICVHTYLYPRAMEAVTELKANGIAVGICTNKPEGLAVQLMTELGVLDEFACLIGADTLPVRKPDPAPFHACVTGCGGDPARAVMIGDSDTDHNTARAAGVPSVLVTFAPGGAEPMRALGPDALLDDYADLPGIVARLLA